eukprot:CAMPEP_0113476692 /NCGR_PEP_ID=MMETSP0014_2-20120614/19804_1 /TAXON_ID=2857 /ORGANISM="Nitzschia sp." /LENGTH=500 /DNA_ID=CAMNT_0000369725 /DNA_START=30 /DNA_END=1532 /DNA_ORIENTATION=- /assembly_acc=CAM_ASM_000159
MSSSVILAAAAAWLVPVTSASASASATSLAFVRQTVTRRSLSSSSSSPSVNMIMTKGSLTKMSSSTSSEEMNYSSFLSTRKRNGSSSSNSIRRSSNRSSSSTSLNGSSRSSLEADVLVGVSRFQTLQKLLSEHGAPGSTGCSKPDHDLQPISMKALAATDDGDDDDEETPELISSITGEGNNDEYLNLHPHLFPIAKSKSTGNIICALRRAFAGGPAGATVPGMDSTGGNSNNAQWPIVETSMDGYGYKLLALNSDHLMKRIVCECDANSERTNLIDLYNDSNKNDALSSSSSAAVTPYEVGSVHKLGYGVDKYVLLRVGPFADIYESLARGHQAKGDESSSLISAEALNNKVSGFASTFLFYAKLLASFPNREEESRDAARMCLRMPLPSIGFSLDDFREVAVLGQIANEDDEDEVVLAKLQAMYEKMKEHESEDPQSPASSNDMTPEQIALDEANYLLDTTALTGGKWSEIRPKLAETYRSVGRDDMAAFVHPNNSSR